MARISSSKQLAPKKLSLLIVGVGFTGRKIVTTLNQEFSRDDYSQLLVDPSPELSAQGQSDIPLLVSSEKNWQEKLPPLLAPLKILMLVVGLGGETDARNVRTICETAKARFPDLPIMMIATLPFAFEGEERCQRAQKTLAELRPLVSAVLALDSKLLFSQVEASTKTTDAFEQVKTKLAEITATLLLPFVKEPLINIEQSQLAWLLGGGQTGGWLGVGIGWGEGTNAVDDAFEQVMSSPFLQIMDPNIHADKALVIVTLPSEGTLEQALGGLEMVQKQFPFGFSPQVGACVDDSVSEGVRIVVVMHFAKTETPVASTPATTAARGQLELQFASSMNKAPRGIFENCRPTRYNNQNLDIPTYIRKHIKIDGKHRSVKETESWKKC